MKEAFAHIVERQYKEKYYTPKELEYSSQVGLFLSPFDYQRLITYKEELSASDNPHIKRIPLPSFNHPCLFYCPGAELTSLLNDYLALGKELPELSDRFSKTFLERRIYSEIEGTLNVESVPTTRRRLKELLEDDAPAISRNDTIIKNMKAGLDFVNQLPPFTKENLFKLYCLLSENCLDDEDKLRPGDFYRYDEVEIDRYYGCPVSRIDECMGALFSFVAETIHANDKYLTLLLPHICHYYLVYIHPYFDYNGRTARMVSYWVYLLSGASAFPPIVSEAINQTKGKYYQSIELARDGHNDLTYFFNYILGISCDYVICYQNLAHMEQIAKNHGVVLTETEANYLKRILVSYGGAFSYSDFLKMANVTMSKQGALKILNKLVSCDLLTEVHSSSKTKLFDLKKENVPLRPKNFGF